MLNFKVIERFKVLTFFGTLVGDCSDSAGYMNVEHWNLDLSIAEGSEHFQRSKARKGKIADSAGLRKSLIGLKR